MYNSTLLENLSLLTEEEIKEFQLFVGSDLHNRGSYPEETRALIALIVRHFPDFNSPDLDKDRAYELILPGQPYIKSKLPKVMTELNQMLKDYVVWKEASKPENEFYQHLEWAKFMRNRGREEKYRLAFEKVKKYQQENNKESPEYFYRNYLMEKEAHEWQSIVNKLKDDVNLLNTIDSLILYFDIQLLAHYNYILLLKKATIIDIPEKTNSYIENTMHLSDRKGVSRLLTASVLINRILLKENPHKQDFILFSEYLSEIESNLSIEVLKDFYTYMRNLCTLLIEGGYTDLTIVLLGLYQKNLTENLLYYNGKIHYGAYFSIVRTALWLDELEWAENFLEEHKGKVLGESDSLEFYYTNLASYYFSKKNYDKALRVLPASSKAQAVQLIIKRIEIKCYFELKSDLLLYKLDAFKVYISRFSDKIISFDVRKRHLGFINIVYRINNLLKEDKKKYSKIITKLSENFTYYYEVKWLNEKINDLQ